jgi:hypothetical protein
MGSRASGSRGGEAASAAAIRNWSSIKRWTLRELDLRREAAEAHRN